MLLVQPLLGILAVFRGVARAEAQHIEGAVVRLAELVAAVPTGGFAVVCVRNLGRGALR